MGHAYCISISMNHGFEWIRFMIPETPEYDPMNCWVTEVEAKDFLIPEKKFFMIEGIDGFEW